MLNWFRKKAVQAMGTLAADVEKHLKVGVRPPRRSELRRHSL